MRLLTTLIFFSLAVFSQAAAKPNILLIITDDQGYGDLSCHGNTVLQTPVLDKLASESVRFDRFYVSPVCAPTRSSLLTGRYSLRTGTRGVASGDEAMRTGETTVAEALRSAGYSTGLFGKWHNGENAPCNPQSQGFDMFYGYTRGHWNNYFDSVVQRNGVPEKAPGFIVDATTQEAIKFIDSAGEKPFFAWVAYTTPHSPFQVPDAYFDRYKAKGLDDELACIYGMCANLDDNVGRLLAHLDAKKLREDTIVIFLTDNGPQSFRFNGGMKGKKGGVDEGSVRVPFFLSWPTRLKTPRLVPQIAGHIDVFPTLMELCGLPMPQTLPLDGRSLVPLLDGKAEAWPERQLFTQWNLGGGGSVKGKGKANSAAAVRSQTHRAVRAGKGWELYDMVADPAQEHDIAAQDTATLAKMSSAYDAWWQGVKTDADMSRDVPLLGTAATQQIELTTPNGRLEGGINFDAKAPNNAWIKHWTNVAANVQWDVDVAEAGDYDIELQYLCPATEAGSHIEVSAGPSKATAEVLPTPMIELPSPDRAPRKSEVYEMQWSRLKMGKLKLPKGQTTIKVQALDIKASEAIQLKAIHLRRE